MIVKIARQQPVEMRRGVDPFANGMRSVGIGHHRERLVQGDQLIDQRLGALVMNIVISRPVDDQ